MPNQSEILAVIPTPLLRREGAGLRQIVKVTVRHDGASSAGELLCRAGREEVVTPLALAAGESTVEAEVPAIMERAPAEFVLRVGGRAAACRTESWAFPRRWVVHVVQLSHHDVGYTDLASHVVPEHDRWLDATIEMAAATSGFPEEARFRAVIEQAWSIDHYLRHASPGRVAAMLELLHRGDMELTALFGNLTTELCGHETLARAVYHAFRLKREHGIPIVSAEHNDIPGLTWGLSQVLTGAGIRIVCPGLPTYYNWGAPGAPSFWDEAAIFGAAGRPGAFWWEAPSGKRVLFWCNNQGCGGGCDPQLPGLAERLRQLEETGYPYRVVRWPVGGGARDNSPYIDGYARTIREWNARWAWPRLVCSTNARFHADLLPQLPDDLPVFRGEVPGQDYPCGAMSTAAATAVNRRNHADLPAAEALAVAGAILSGRSDLSDLSDRSARAYEEVLWHDEHTWGHHFPAGPTAAAAELEKAVHAHRAAALVHDVANKAMARIADAVRIEAPDLHLVVFNPLPRERSGLVSTPLRELDNCGSTMVRTEQGTLRGALLGDRWHVNPPPEIVAGLFDLIDVATGEAVPYQIETLDSPLGPQPYAAQRLGLGAGSKRYGFFELPGGLARDLVFLAHAVPALGYRSYRLRRRDAAPAFAAEVTASDAALESAFYRLELDPATGFVRRILDRESGRDLADRRAVHPFGAVLVRDPHGAPELPSFQGIQTVAGGPLCNSLRAVFATRGHPRIEVTYTLFAREKRLDAAIALLKDPTPLLEVYAAFPFDMPGGHFRCEGPLCVVDPGRDLMPGAYADRITVQNWIAVSDGAHSVLWSSHDAPVVSLARLWPGRISPAHSAVVRADLVHPCQTAEDLRGGAIYSLLAANNFGTNLAVSQSGALRFRYSFTSLAGAVSDGEAAARGAAFVTPMQTMFTVHPGPRPLPPTGGVLAVEPDDVRLVTLKRAEDGRGWIVRLWNAADRDVPARVALLQGRLSAARLTSLAEEDTGETLAVSPDSLSVPLPARSVVTLRLNPDACDLKLEAP